MTIARHQDYRHEVSDFRLASSRGGVITGAALVLLGIGLDYGLYPQHLAICSVPCESSSRH